MSADGPEVHAVAKQAQSHRRHLRAVLVILIAVVLMATTGVYAYWNMAISRHNDPRGIKTASETSADRFARKYPPLHSHTDEDHDGIDDYSDIVQGARNDARALPAYDNGYYQNGYPPGDRGACTDLVWRAFANAGYDLKAMVDADIATHPGAYRGVTTSPDPNIDFRRTGVLDVFFSRYGRTLTTDPRNIGQWQQGDVIVFEHTRHIGVTSDRRDGQGVPLVLHNMGNPHREDAYLNSAHHMRVSGHYRFDVSKIPASSLRHWRGHKYLRDTT